MIAAEGFGQYNKKKKKKKIKKIRNAMRQIAMGRLVRVRKSQNERIWSDSTPGETEPRAAQQPVK